MHHETDSRHELLLARSSFVIFIIYLLYFPDKLSVLEVNQRSASSSDQSNLSFWCANAKASCLLSACSAGSTKGHQWEGNA